MAVQSSRYLLSDKMQALKPYFRLRDAIFELAIDDWRAASPKAKEYIRGKYASLPKWRREEIKDFACMKHLKWYEAAESYDFFHDGEADKYLIDTPYTGAEVWEIMTTGSWNRGGQKDKPYRVSRLPTAAECAKPLDKRFKNCPIERNDFLFASAKKQDNQQDNED